eukprot:TRINITY_DN2007_c0_g1_i5.p1 TRINITY_DN2007_c0_g1~~TRINITY_DN2007_c0_g1_i5.p1  ORF type:complete len:281 (-),score=51.00 TRINITY_DN2007_c0_g1_i5:40-882(-)
MLKRASIYGMSLEELMELDGPSSNKVPYVIKLCVDFIKIHGLDIQGIFREPGHQVSVDKLASLFYSIDLSLVGGISPTIDVHVVAELLKKVLRDLPEPLFTFHLFDSFCKCLDIDDEKDKISRYRELYLQLPTINQAVIDYLFPVLLDVHHHRDRNLMDLTNIATIFGPTLLRSKETDYFSTHKSAQVMAEFLQYFGSVTKKFSRTASPVLRDRAKRIKKQKKKIIFKAVHADPLTSFEENVKKRHNSDDLELDSTKKVKHKSAQQKKKKKDNHSRMTST